MVGKIQLGYGEMGSEEVRLKKIEWKDIVIVIR